MADCLGKRERLIIGHREAQADGLADVRLVRNVEHVAADGLDAVVEPDNRASLGRAEEKPLSVGD